MTAVMRLPLVEQRPRTRGECADVARPCPWASCRHSLLVDIDARGHAHEVALPETSTACALDVADGGESSLEDLAEIAGVTRERIRQIESKALDAIRGHRGRVLAELVDEGKTVGDRRPSAASRSREVARESPEPAERRRDDDDPSAGQRISFFAEGEGADDLVCDMVWRIFAKDSTARGFDARSANAKRMTEWRKNNPTKGMRPFAAVNARKLALMKRKETEMPVNQMTPRLERVLAIYREGITSPTGIAARVGGEMTTSNISNTLTALRKLGHIPPGQPGGKGAAKPMPPRVNPRKHAPDPVPPEVVEELPAPSSVPVPEETRPAAPAAVLDVPFGSQTALAIRAEIDACERKAGALRRALAALEEAGIA